MTPSETEVLKMFDEKFYDKNICCGGDFHKGIEHLRLEDVRDFLLAQLRVARADERKAWLAGERCGNCGEEMTPKAFTNTCAKCWEEV